MVLSSQTLTAIAACAFETASNWVMPLGDAMREFDIQNGLRASAFLAQVVHESDGLAVLTENLNYSAKRLVKVWPKHFSLAPDLQPDLNDANRYANRPEALANLVYATRMGNGSVQSGDGWRFRGRGLIQLTGRTAYRHASDALGVDFVAAPDLLLVPVNAARSAAWYWSSIDGNAFADENTLSAFEKLTVAINGDLMGLQERIGVWARAKGLLCNAD